MFLGNKSLELQANRRFEWRGPWGSLILSPRFTAEQVTPHEVESLGRITPFLSDRAQSRGSSRPMLRKRSPGVRGACLLSQEDRRCTRAGGGRSELTWQATSQGGERSELQVWRVSWPHFLSGPRGRFPGSAVWPQLCLRLQTPQSLCDAWGYRCHQAFPVLSSPESWTQMFVLRIV